MGVILFISVKFQIPLSPSLGKIYDGKEKSSIVNFFRQLRQQPASADGELLLFYLYSRLALFFYFMVIFMKYIISVITYRQFYLVFFFRYYKLIFRGLTLNGRI